MYCLLCLWQQSKWFWFAESKEKLWSVNQAHNHLEYSLREKFQHLNVETYFLAQGHFGTVPELGIESTDPVTGRWPLYHWDEATLVEIVEICS